MKKLFFLMIPLFTACMGSNNENAVAQRRIPIARSAYKTIRPSIHYTNIFSEPKMTNLVMIGKVGKYGVGGDDGKLLRALRFKDIAAAVERRYNLPPHILLAMVAQESSGVDLLPNGQDDGGFGLCHMQPLLANQFGLKTYAGCKSMRCTKHGVVLRKIIERNKFDRKKVIQYDDRFHPILNLDAAARMLTFYVSGKRIAGLGPFRTALCRYAGKYNYRTYWSNVKRFMSKLEDPAYMAKIEKQFNKLNPRLTINGKKADFDSYMNACWQQQYNYGLTEYRKLPLLLPENSMIVLKTYRKFL